MSDIFIIVYVFWLVCITIGLYLINSNHIRSTANILEIIKQLNNNDVVLANAVNETPRPKEIIIPVHSSYDRLGKPRYG